MQCGLWGFVGINRMRFNVLLMPLIFTLNLFAIEPGSFEEKAAGLPWKCDPKPGLPNVLIIGDSISIGYTLDVRRLLKGKANVYRPIENGGKRPENCGHSTSGLKRINKWLEIQNVKTWDVIHFNWGLHDLKRIDRKKGLEHIDPTIPSVVSLEKYRKNLKELVSIMKQTKAKLIFATTTPYPDGVTPCRLPADASKYNNVAIEVMKEEGVEINDLFTHIKPKLETLQIPVNVHFNEKGSKYLAEKVVKIVEKSL